MQENLLKIKSNSYVQSKDMKFVLTAFCKIICFDEIMILDFVAWTLPKARKTYCKLVVCSRNKAVNSNYPSRKMKAAALKEEKTETLFSHF